MIHETGGAAPKAARKMRALPEPDKDLPRTYQEPIKNPQPSQQLFRLARAFQPDFFPQRQ